MWPYFFCPWLYISYLSNWIILLNGNILEWITKQISTKNLTTLFYGYCNLLHWVWSILWMNFCAITCEDLGKIQESDQRASQTHTQPLLSTITKECNQMRVLQIWEKGIPPYHVASGVRMCVVISSHIDTIFWNILWAIRLRCISIVSRHTPQICRI